MASEPPKKALGNLVVFAGSCFLISVFIGIGIAVVLGLIPTFLAKQSLNPTGEDYCIYNLQLYVIFNNSGYSLTSTVVNNSYPLSQACYRNLQSYKSDSLLQSCLISNCNFTNNITTSSFNGTQMSCTAVIYYSTRCSDAPPNYALNNSANSTGNTACRRIRMSNINGALGSSSFANSTGSNSNAAYVLYTNVPSLLISNQAISVTTIYGVPFSNSSQVGARYCGAISRSNISASVNAQASG